MIRFDVLGEPAPKGSNRAMIRGGRAVFVPGGSKVNQTKLKSWDAAVREAALFAMGRLIAPPYVEQPLRVAITFRMARPSGHWGKGRNVGKLKPNAPPYPIRKPDIDKLVRTTLDAISGSIFDDDARIVELDIGKVYARPGEEGALIEIMAMSETLAACIERELDNPRPPTDALRDLFRVRQPDKTDQRTSDGGSKDGS